MKLAREIYTAIRPQRPQHFNLLFTTFAAIAEIFVERDKFHIVPTDAYP